jgi:hypothetical protein
MPARLDQAHCNEYSQDPGGFAGGAGGFEGQVYTVAGISQMYRRLAVQLSGYLQRDPLIHHAFMLHAGWLGGVLDSSCPPVLCNGEAHPNTDCPSHMLEMQTYQPNLTSEAGVEL